MNVLVASKSTQFFLALSELGCSVKKHPTYFSKLVVLALVVSNRGRPSTGTDKARQRFHNRFYKSPSVVVNFSKKSMIYKTNWGGLFKRENQIKFKFCV